MQRKSTLMTAASAAFLLAFSALAQDANPPAKDADNTERNAKDRSNQTLTPMDQGNSKADLEMTAQIRKEIVDAKNMSVNAQNVKIITYGGKVTLRGPVNTADEKRLIGEIAEKYATSENVDNQLEVKLITNSNGQPAAPVKP